MAFPVMKCLRTPDGIQLVFWCWTCRELHYHGSGGEDKPFGSGDGHRTSHCLTNPALEKGYILREVTKDEFAETLPTGRWSMPKQTRKDIGL